MTGNEAIVILLNAYKNEVKKGGRGCGKTALRTALLMGANAISIIQQAMGGEDYWTGEKVEMLKEVLKKEAIIPREQYEELREAFVDFVCSGVNNPAPYCKNSCDECVDGRGWCTYKRCRGFNPDGRVYDEI